MDRTQKRNRAEWEDPRNWHAGLLGIYTSSRDSRLIVPKRNPLLGWTINFAHPRAVWAVAAAAAAPFVVGALKRMLGSEKPSRPADHW